MTSGASATQKIFKQIELIAKSEVKVRQDSGSWEETVKPLEQYQKDPMGFFVNELGLEEKTIRWSLSEAYGIHEWDGTVDPIAEIAEALARGEDVGVESATGVGKTFIGACIVLWFIASFREAISVTVAPKEDQLFKHIWKEIGRLFPRFKKIFPHAELITGQLRMLPSVGEKERWGAFAVVAAVGAAEDSATRIQGYHAEHMLFITEETPGIAGAIMNAIFNTRSDDHNLHLAFGNPDHQFDELHKFCMMPGVRHIRISAFDHPNVVTGERLIPGAIGAKRLEARIEVLGVGSRMYNSRIRGICAAEASEAIIKMVWIEQAVRAWNDDAVRKEMMVGRKALGVDVANSEGGDKAAISRWQGSVLTEVESRACPDSNELGRAVVLEAKETGVDAKRVGFDASGVGAGAVNEAKRLDFRAQALHSGQRANPLLDIEGMWEQVETTLEGDKAAGPRIVQEERFGNLRAQSWWLMREDLRLGRIALPPDDELHRDLVTPTYKLTNGVIYVEDKEQLKKRLGRSPDKGDAAVLGNFVRFRGKARKGAVTVPETTADRDYGLEKHVLRMEKERRRQARENRRVFGALLK